MDEVRNREHEIFGIPFTEPELPLNEDIVGWDLPKAEQKFIPDVIPDYMEEQISYKEIDHLTTWISGAEDAFHEYKMAANADPKVIDKKRDAIRGAKDRISELKGLEKKQTAFVIEQYRRYKEGRFYYVNGDIIYITGHHWKYLNYFHLKVNADNPRAIDKRPSFRGRDVKFFYAAHTALNDPMCSGFVTPKQRREGMTSKCESIQLDRSTIELVGAPGGMQASNEIKAKKNFKDLSSAFEKLPWWFKPIHDGMDKPETEIKLQFPTSKSRRKKNKNEELDEILDRIPKSLPQDIYRILTANHESLIDQRAAKPQSYNGKALYTKFDDEVGETERRHSIIERYNNLEPAIKLSEREFWGKMMFVGVIDDYNTKKFCCDEFEQMFKESFYWERNEIGKTRQGLYAIFIPVTEGANGFYDEYGMSDKEELEKEFTRRRDELRDNPQKLDKEVRQYPMVWTDCFRKGGGSSPLNAELINQRLDYFIEHGRQREADGSCRNPFIQRYDLYWENGISPVNGNIPEGETPQVKIRRNDRGGRFYLSWKPEVGQQNLVKKIRVGQGMSFAPENRVGGVVGADPFAFDTVEGTRKSDGAGSAFRRYNPIAEKALDKIPQLIVDAGELAVLKYKVACKTNRTVCDYLHRPNTVAEYCEDILKICWFFGYGLFEERVNNALQPKFLEWRCEGFLTYDYTDQGKKKVTSGGNSKGTMRAAMFTAVDTHYEHNIQYEVHDTELEDALKVTFDNMKDTDAFVASAYAKYEAYLMLDKVLERRKKKSVVTDKPKIKQLDYHYDRI